METKDKISTLLEMQEQAHNMEEKELERIMEDKEMRELAEQLATMKRAFVRESIADDDSLVEEEWAKFERKHFGKDKTHLSLNAKHSLLFKVAAVFVGVILLSGITIAAVYTVQGISERTGADDVETAAVAAADNDTKTAMTAGYAQQTEETGEPVVFDNITLDKILCEIAEYYSVKVDFRNTDTKQLRFHFVWRKELGIEKVVEDMNHFERVNINYKDSKLTVE